MEFTSGNKAVRDHLDEGEELHLFESLPAPGGRVRYIGEMVCTGTRMDRGPDRDGHDRREIVFQLIRKSAIAGEEPEAEVEPRLSGLSMTELRDRALDASASSRPPRERTTAYRERSAAIKLYARRRAGGACEGCSCPAPFVTGAGDPYLEVHHTRRLSDEGPDHPAFVVAICPTCHRRAHYAHDAVAYNEKLRKTAADLET
jgi:5-methylcytosine-specific restriction enzyme A